MSKVQFFEVFGHNYEETEWWFCEECVRVKEGQEVVSRPRWTEEYMERGVNIARRECMNMEN